MVLAVKRSYCDIEDNDKISEGGDHIFKKSKTIYDALSDLTETFKAIDEETSDQVPVEKVHCVDLNFFERAIVMASSCGHKNQYFLQIKTNIVGRPVLAFMCVKCDFKTLFTGIQPNQDCEQVKVTTKELDSFTQQIQISESMETSLESGHIRQIKGKSEPGAAIGTLEDCGTTKNTDNLEDQNCIKESDIGIDVNEVHKVSDNIKDKVILQKSNSDLMESVRTEKSLISDCGTISPILENPISTKEKDTLENQNSTKKSDPSEDLIIGTDSQMGPNSLLCDDQKNTDELKVNKGVEEKNTQLIKNPFRDETASDSDNESLPDIDIASEDESMPDDTISEDESIPDAIISEKLDGSETEEILQSEGTVSEANSLQNVTVSEDKSLQNVTVSEDKSLKNVAVSNIILPEDKSLTNVITLEDDSLADVMLPECKSSSNVTLLESKSSANVIFPEDKSVTNVITLENDSLADVMLPESKSSSNVTLLEDKSLPDVITLEDEILADKTVLEDQLWPVQNCESVNLDESMLPKKSFKNNGLKLRPMKELMNKEIPTKTLFEPSNKLDLVRSKFSKLVSGTNSHISVPVMPSFETNNRSAIAPMIRTYSVQDNSTKRYFYGSTTGGRQKGTWQANHATPRMVVLRRPKERESVLKGTWHAKNENGAKVDTPFSMNGQTFLDKVSFKVDTPFSNNDQSILSKAISETFHIDTTPPTRQNISETLTNPAMDFTSVLEKFINFPSKKSSSEIKPQTPNTATTSASMPSSSTIASMETTLPTVEATVTQVTELPSVESQVAKPSPVKLPAAKSSPVKSQVGKPSPVKLPVTESSPVKSPVTEPTPIKLPVTESSPDKSPVTESSPVKLSVNESSPVKLSVNESSLIKLAVNESSPVKSQVTKPPPPFNFQISPVKLSVTDTSPVKSQITKPSPVKSSSINSDPSSLVSMVNTLLNSDIEKESPVQSENERSTEFHYDGGVKSTKRVSKFISSIKSINKSKNWNKGTNDNSVPIPMDSQPLQNQTSSSLVDQESSTSTLKAAKQQSNRSLIFLPNLPDTNQPNTHDKTGPIASVGTIKDHDNKNGPVCFKCSKICKDAANLKNHILSHFYDAFDDVLPKQKPFTCPECTKPSRDKITALRHFAFTHRKLFQLTEVTPDHLKC